MNLALVLHVHGDPKLVSDTLKFVHKWATDRSLVAVDGNSPEWVEEADLSAPHFVGFRNKTRDVFRNHSLYRNYTLGLMKVMEQYPNQDWYCSAEYDVLFCSDEFKADLNKLPPNIWLAGFNGRRTFMSLPFLEAIVGEKCYTQNYFIGCCMFFRGEFLRRIRDAGLFNRVLEYTNGFDHGYFPNYWEQGGYDFTECLFPTLVNIVGGDAVSFSSWDDNAQKWSGDYKKYPIRWPDAVGLEDAKDASIVHPVKEFSHPTRVYHRKKLGNCERH